MIAAKSSMSPLIEAIEQSLTSQGEAVHVHLQGAELSQIPDVERAGLLITGGVHCGAEDMDRLPLLHSIVSPFLGYDWIDVDQATARGIAVVNANAPEVRESMAEATIMLLLASLYRLQATELSARDPRPATRVTRHMLKGQIVGIIGFGGISREIIHRLKNWDCDILVATRADIPADCKARKVSLQELLTTSDAVVVMTSLTSETYQILSRAELELLKKGAVVVNTARGELIEENALVNGILSGHVAAAALDVFEEEPLSRDSALWSLPNTILTPHAIGHTAEAIRALPEVTGSNVFSLLGGRLPASCCNPEVEQAWLARHLVTRR